MGCKKEELGVKYMRDYLSDGSVYFASCGDCGHLLVSHTNWAELPILNKQGMRWVDRCHVTYDGPIKLPEQCRCTEWVPKDNLDRIEFLAEKRGLLNGQTN